MPGTSTGFVFGLRPAGTRPTRTRQVKGNDDEKLERRKRQEMQRIGDRNEKGNPRVSEEITGRSTSRTDRHERPKHGQYKTAAGSHREEVSGDNNPESILLEEETRRTSSATHPPLPNTSNTDCSSEEENMNTAHSSAAKLRESSGNIRKPRSDAEFTSKRLEQKHLGERGNGKQIRPSAHPSLESTKNEAVSKQQPTDQPAEVASKRGPLILSFLPGFQNRLSEKCANCVICMADDIPISRTAKLACSHRMCHKCLKRLFTLSVTDPQHMPPRCCTAKHIPLGHVEKLFDTKFKLVWNKKFKEYTSKDRIYCPSRGCGEWIKPKNIYLDKSGGPSNGRKYGKCSKCKTKVCVICNGKMHRAKDCPKDEESRKFNAIANKEGWRRCFNCSAMVELKEGCNHIVCRCTAEFCILCGSKWKTCDCPWFNYDPGSEEGSMNVADARVAFEPGNESARAPIRYQQEFDTRRRRELQDEELARELQNLDRHGRDDLNEIPRNFQPQDRGSPGLKGDEFSPIDENHKTTIKAAGTSSRLPSAHLDYTDPSDHGPAHRRRRRLQAKDRNSPHTRTISRHWRSRVDSEDESD